MKRYLYCIARGRNSQWEAVCLDFDIAVQGRSFEEVNRLLGEVIVDYVKEAVEQPDDVRDALLSRRAPFRTRAMWRWRLALAALSARSHTAESTYGFPVPCPA